MVDGVDKEWALWTKRIRPPYLKGQRYITFYKFSLYF
jgi:hypothetical protein